MKRVAPSHFLLLLPVAAVFAWSGWQPTDRFTWYLEVFPGVAGLFVLAATYRRFRLTTLCYAFIAAHICILCVGGHYTYARVPLFEWLKPIFHWQRNDYDRLGHFAQGFVPALITREVFLRLEVMRRRTWIPFLTLAVCMFISAFYELVEWWTALSSGSASDAFLGTQGDVWDTQEDMFMALIGATCALIFFRGLHDRAIARLTTPVQTDEAA
jgi:putative membrane protein